MQAINPFDIFKGVHNLTKLPENEVQRRSKPRASSLTSDARELAYSMAGTAYSDPHSQNLERVDGALTAETGRMFEDLLILALEHMDSPIKVTGRQMALPESYFVTGHPDGIVDNDLIESKHYGRFAYKEIARDGIWGDKGRSVLAQCALYCDALDLDGAHICITAQDASSLRYELGKKSDVHPKMMTFYVPREQLQGLIPQLKLRAEFFINWMQEDGDPASIMCETEPGPKRFPWSYSEYLSRAIADGAHGRLVAPRPFEWN